MKYYKIMLLAISVLAMSCAKDKEAENITKQEEIIEAYWAKLEIDNINVFEKDTDEDIFRVVLQKGDETQSIAAGDSIHFFYTGAIFTDKGLELSRVFDTNEASVAKELKLSTEQELKIREDVAGMGRFVSGLEKGILRMHKGEEAHIIFTSKFGYGDKAMSTIPKYSPIIFKVKIVEVIKKR